MALTLTPSTPTPLRTTRPVISTPASSFTSTGRDVALTDCARNVLVANPSRLKTTSYVPSFSRRLNVPSLPVRTTSSSRSRCIAMTTRRTPPKSPRAASAGVTPTPETGRPFASSTLPLKATPRGIVIVTPLFFSPGLRRTDALCAVGRPFFAASIWRSVSVSTLCRTNRPSGPLNAVVSCAKRPGPIIIIGLPAALRGSRCAPATARLSSSITVPLMRARAVP